MAEKQRTPEEQQEWERRRERHLRKEWTPEELRSKERFREQCRIGLLCEEFCIPEANRERIGAMLFEVDEDDRPDEFWRLARATRRKIISGEFQEVEP
jgi:hypothetical protein